MKTYKIDIHPCLEDVKITVKNGAFFERCIIKGDYHIFNIKVDESDIDRVKRFAVKHGNDKFSNKGNWYAHCNGYAMDLCVCGAGKIILINTYRPYSRINI